MNVEKGGQRIRIPGGTFTPEIWGRRSTVIV